VIHQDRLKDRSLVLSDGRVPFVSQDDQFCISNHHVSVPTARPRSILTADWKHFPLATFQTLIGPLLIALATRQPWREKDRKQILYKRNKNQE
ncbi:hypothetical protein Bpfe_028693, partial [Biomphalaria pfeifferi]